MGKIFHVVLTGGVGSRLWPLSRKSKPKQYIELFAKNSLFELAVKRNAIFSDELIVVGNTNNRKLSEKSLEKLGVKEFINIVEATPRNTAPAIAFAAFAAQAEDVLLVTPADHIISEGVAYNSAIKRAIYLAQKGSIVTFGVQPNKPETGYGYIEHDKEDVISFREKPNKATAMQFLESGNFVWNSGMFCFKASVFLKELQKYEPEVYQKSLEVWNSAEDGKLKYEESMQIPSISIDYAVMEKSEKIKVVPADFKWSDMGSFEAVYDYLKEQGYAVDENGNMVIGSDKFTAFVGLKNCILVCAEGANLVLSKESSQDVKKIFQKLETENPSLIN